MSDSQLETGGASVFDSPLIPDVLSTDELFTALSSRRRRYVLHCLGEHRTTISLADLADEVATRERDASIADVPAEEVKQVYLSLYHTHVPQLADVNLVEYSQERDHVSLSAEREQVEALLEFASMNE